MRKDLVRWTATVSALFAWTYIAFVLLLGRSIGWLFIGFDIVIPSVLLVGVAAWWLAGRIIARGGGGTLLRASVMVLFGFGSLAVADVAYSMVLNARDHGKPMVGDSRGHDPGIAIGEILPRLYYPTDANFRLHKPDVLIQAAPYGGYYHPGMLESPTLAPLLQRHRFSVAIDSHGLRNTTPLDSSEVFALGDSYTFGWAVDASDSWVGRLGTLMDRPVYNLGMHDASPKQELELLRYLLRTHGDSMRVRRVLWMIYEGNDLEDSYAEHAPQPWVRSRHLTDDTVLEDVRRFPWRVQQQSILHRLLSGEISFRTPGQRSRRELFMVDGVPLWHPLYESETLGPRLFQPVHIERAQQPDSYVREHPNRPHLDAVFDDMARLALEHSFDVTVIIAPTAARLQGAHYEDFPQLSDEPWFIDYVAQLADRHGFQVVDLLRQLHDHAGQELLHLRADGHWNRRGNELAAEVIHREAFP